MTKKCNTCSKIKKLSEFHKTQSKTGYRAICKLCANEKSRNKKVVISNCSICKKEKTLRYKNKTICNVCYSNHINPSLYKKQVNRMKESACNAKEKYAKGRRQAKSGALEWTISFDDYTLLNSKKCFYCSDDLPLTTVGLDRIDNSKGYSIDNVLPCCLRCNAIRGDKLTVYETISAINAVKSEQYEKISRVHESSIDIDNYDIYIFDEINQESLEIFTKNIRYFENINSYLTINIHIMSSGGDWNSGLSFYDIIRTTTLKTNAIAYGEVSSSATIIFLACSYRYAHIHSTFLIHSGSEYIECNPHDAKDHIREISRQFNIMCDIYNTHSNKDIDYWKDLSRTEYYISAEDAISLKMVDEILYE